jgi:hypothetical protein
MGMPQITFALSRGFAVGGTIYPHSSPKAALKDSLALGYKYAAPLGLLICSFADR